MTSSYRMNTKVLSGKKVWSPAHTKNLFPEHITEVDYFHFDPSEAPHESFKTALKTTQLTR